MGYESVPFIDLKISNKKTLKYILNNIEKVLKSGNFILGDKVKIFEKNIADYCQCKEAIGVSSGTDALLMALMAIDIAPGDEVITTPFTFIAAAEVIARLGAKPVFVDINQSSYNIDPLLIEEKITKKTKAIIPVHLFGQIADMKTILEIAKKYNLYVIEDAAQAIGAEYNNKKAGSFGDIGCFSFYPTKNLGCIGDGGLLTTNHEELAAKIRLIRNHGSNRKYMHAMPGGNFRLDAIQAEVLNYKLNELEKNNNQRKINASVYNDNLGDYVSIPEVVNNNQMIYHQYTIRTEKRDELKIYLDKNNIGNEIYYPIPLHLQECFSYLNYKIGDFPITEKISKEVLSLPIYSGLKETQILYIIDTVMEFFSSN